MAKKKRLNKNLVAFLTVMGIILVVSVVGLVIRQGAQRDPEALARQARALEQTRELDEAAKLYQQAYKASNEQDNSYLLDAARCVFELGGVSGWLEILHKAHAKNPSDQTLVIAVLEGLWRLSEIEGRGFWWKEWRDYSEKLLELDSENVLGLVCRANGYWEPILGEEEWDLGDGAALKAYELYPRDPRVAATYVKYLRRHALADIQEGIETGATSRELEQRERKFVAEALDVLEQATQVNPADAALVTAYGGYLHDQARRLRDDEKAAPADEQLAHANEILERALTLAQQELDAVEEALDRKPVSVQELRGLWERRQKAHWQLPELHLALAQVGLAQFSSKREELSPEQQAALLTRIGESANRAVELDPAMYDAYVLRANLKLFSPDSGTADQETRWKQFELALGEYEQAAAQTSTLRNLRAALTEQKRLLMLYRAFVTALGYLDAVTRTGDEEKQASARTLAAGFLDDVRTKWPNAALTHFMQGLFSMVSADRVAAIQAFERAHEKQSSERYWLGVARVDVLPRERLAGLYLEEGQLGEAQRHAEEAIRQYQQYGRVPPVRLLLARVDIHDRLEQRRAALDLLDQYRQLYPDDPLLAAARASILTKLGRLEEAAEEEKKFVGEDANVRTRLWQAGQALEREDATAAEELARGVLADGEATDGEFQAAFVMLISIMENSDRREEAQQYVRSLLQSPPRAAEGVITLLRTYDILLSEEDEEKRNAKLREAIAQVSDPRSRAERFVNFYVSQRDYQQALASLQELRRLQPDDPSLIEREFGLRLRLAQQHSAAGHEDQAAAQYAAATELLVPLSQSNEGRGLDRVGGATYRGRLALARGEPGQAILEYREAVLGLPKSAELQVNLARAYLSAGRTTECVESLKRAITFNPRSAEAHGLLTNAYDELADQAFGAERDAHVELASRHFEELSKLVPTSAFVRQRQQRLAEEANPLGAIAERERKRAEYARQRAENPEGFDQQQELVNLVRLADLYDTAWAAADEAGDEDAQRKLMEQADAFFSEAVASTTEAVQLQLVQQAATYYARSGQRDKGKTFLCAFRDQQTGLEKIALQLLLARFFESQRDAEAAERAYRRAQAMVREVITDPEQRRRANQQVGLSFIEFYERWALAPQVIEVCRWMLDQFPPESDAVQDVRQRLIEALFNAGRLGEMETEIGAYVQTYGEDLSALTARAKLHLRRNRREAARRDLTAMLALDPENIQALLARSELAMKGARYDAAREDLMRAKDLVAPGSSWELGFRTLLADFYERTDQLELAAGERQTLLEALQAKKGRPEQIQQVVSGLVRLYRKMNQLERAQRLISEYMEKNPDDAIWPLRLGQLLEARAEAALEKNELERARRDYAAAAGYYERAAEKSGTKSPARMSKALAARITALTKAEQPREAVEVFLNLPFERPAPNLRLAVAKAYWALNERDQAVEQWQLALSDASMVRMGMVGAVADELRETFQPGDAERLLRHVVERAPVESSSGQRLRVVLADQLARSDAPADALPVINEILENAPAGTPEHVAALLTQARVKDVTGDYEAAATAYREVLTFGENVVALNNLAYLLVKTEAPGFPRPQEALKYAERLESLVEGSPNVADMLDTVGWVYYKYGLSAADRRAYLDRAVAALEQALKLASEPSLTMYEHMGQIYSEVGRNAEARTMLKRGLQQAEKKGDRERVERFKELINELR
ncbi:MAG: tetratricopeptide repeat protein [Phycisphaerae bacterium]|nr:tetratricopeptide repeat protein [Phycisphaerae bacterium]